jgi:MscS family membrane protein
VAVTVTWLAMRIIDVVETSGTGFAFPSQTLYLGKDDGLDEERTREAEQEVRLWREQQTLNLPDFPASAQQDLKGALSYPDEGSSLARPRSGAGDDE